MGFTSNILADYIYPCSAMHVPAPGIPASPDPTAEHLQEQGDLDTFPDHFTLVTGTSSDSKHITSTSQIHGEEWARCTCPSASARCLGQCAGWVPASQPFILVPQRT